MTSAAATPVAGPAPALDCPVCPRTALAPGMLACPNCQTALTPLWRLRDLGARFYNDGLEAARRGDIESAARKLSTALELGADESSTHLLLGKLLWRAGQHTSAAAHWQRAQAAAPARAECAPLLRMAERRRRARRLTAGLALLFATAAAAAQLWSGSARSAPAATAQPAPPPAAAPRLAADATAGRATAAASPAAPAYSATAAGPQPRAPGAKSAGR